MLSVWAKLAAAAAADLLGAGCGAMAGDSPGESVSGAREAASLNAASDCEVVLQRGRVSGVGRWTERERERNVRVDDADEALLAVPALRAVEEDWIRASDVDGERGELSGD